MSTATSMPPEADIDALGISALEGYVLEVDDVGAPVRVAVVRYDETAECPLDLGGCGAWTWVDHAPWWATGPREGARECAPFEVEDTPRGSVAFAVEEQRDGNHYYPASPGGIIPAGYITPPPGCAADSRQEYVAGILALVTSWATGDVYWVDVLERVTWHEHDNPARTRTTWEPWEEPAHGGLYGIEAARTFILEEYGPEGAA